MTKKQLIMLIEGNVLDDNVCITEGDMCYLFENYADTFETKSVYGNVEYTMTRENSYWQELRPFLPRKGNKLKRLKIKI